MHGIVNNSHGPEVLFVHGNSLGHEVWREQYQDPMLGAFRLSAVDLPGHGKSAWLPAGRSYSLRAFADSVAAHVRTMHAPVLVGHSLGGHICLRVLAMVPGIRGLLLFGTPPLSSAADIPRCFLPSPALEKAFQAQLTRAEANELATALSWVGNPLIPEMARMVTSTDPRVRGDLGLELVSGEMEDEQAMMRMSDVPVCIVHGSSDPFLSIPYFEEIAAEFFWRGRVHIVPGAGHCPHMQQPQVFNNILNEFICSL